MECGEVVLDTTLGPGERKPRVAVVSRGVGGRAAFSCPPGWALTGPSETVCSPAADWAKPFPVCRGIILYYLHPALQLSETVLPAPGYPVENNSSSFSKLYFNAT